MPLTRRDALARLAGLIAMSAVPARTLAAAGSSDPLDGTAVAGSRRTPYYYRTEDGAEVDLLFERGGRVEMAIEIKRSTAPELSRGFRSARDVLKPKQSYLLHSGDDTWPVETGVEAISLRDLMQRLGDEQA